jgi:hypothetical protein
MTEDLYNPYLKMAEAICYLKGRGMSNRILQSLVDLFTSVPFCGYDNFLVELGKYEDKSPSTEHKQPSEHRDPATATTSQAPEMRLCRTCGVERPANEFYKKNNSCKHCLALKRAGLDLKDINNSPAIQILLKNGFAAEPNETWDCQVIARMLHVQQKTAMIIMDRLVEEKFADRWTRDGRQYYFRKVAAGISEPAEIRASAI